MTTGPPVLQTGSGNRNALWVIPEVESGKVYWGLVLDGTWLLGVVARET